MSHIVQIQTKVQDPAAVAAACVRLRLAPPSHASYQLFSSTVTGLGVQLPEWRYPVVCDLRTGQVQFDNFEGRWGEQSQLDRFLQSYATEKAKIEAHKRGYSVTEQPLQDGSIKLAIYAGGAA